ncbi:MAG: hypothetical protein QW076_02945 [Candidatus Anstonellales archaeon]
MFNKKYISLSKILIVLFSFFIFTILFSSLNKNNNYVGIVLASPDYKCKVVTASCGDPKTGNPNHPWSSLGDSFVHCKDDKDIIAVKCPLGYKVINGGCTVSTSDEEWYGTRLYKSCPTNDPKAGDEDEGKGCPDWSGAPGYEWWYCNFRGDVKWETAYAICCVE